MANNTGPLNDKEIIQLLDVLQPVPGRDPGRAAEGRARFIKEAREMQIRASRPVSVSPFTSLKVWMDKIIQPFKTIKENTMIMKFSAIVFVIAILFGGAGTAVQAAGGSLPGQPIYPLKLMVEEMRGVVTTPEGRVEQALQRVESRVQEILRLREQEQPVPESAFTRLESQVEQTLRLMLKLNEGDFAQELAQVRTRLMEQEQALAGMQGQQPEDAGLLRLRTMLQERLQLLGDGTEDPEQIRQQIQDRDRVSRPTGAGTQPANGPGAGPGPSNQNGAGTCTPVQDGTGAGPGPSGSGTGTPAGNGTGPGPGPFSEKPTGTCTPVQDGTGPGPGPATTVTPGSGTGPGLEKTPAPGGGPGPGPGAGEATPSGTPVQDGTGPGPGPGTGNPTGTCTPVQDGTGPGPGPGGGSTPTPGGSGSGGKP